jgi:hypothetical protein
MGIPLFSEGTSGGRTTCSDFSAMIEAALTGNELIARLNLSYWHGLFINNIE